jgi:hypothetical protein
LTLSFDCKKLELIRVKNVKEDISGKVFTKLTVVKYAQNGLWECYCECGNTTFLKKNRLTSMHTRSCGCMKKDNAIYKREHSSWKHMIARCKNQQDYLDVKICDSWIKSFKTFIFDMGAMPVGAYSIDRIDNSKGYNKP